MKKPTRARSAVTVLAAIALGAAGFFLVWSLPGVSCTRESRAAVMEPAAFGEAHIGRPKPSYFETREICGTTFSTTAPAQDVIAHYRTRLESLGWRVRVYSDQEILNTTAGGGCDPRGGEPLEEQLVDPPDAEPCPQFERLTAVRAELCYDVTTQHYPTDVPDPVTAYLTAGPCEVLDDYTPEGTGDW
jgi:hypothetical protein